MAIKTLIVNGDFFGQSHGINRGIIKAFEEGILTGASLMVRWPGAEAAADYYRENRKLSVGLHIDSHQHVLREEPVRSILGEVSSKLGVPLRHFDPNIAHVGSFYGQDELGNSDLQRLAPSSLMKILQSLPEGISELACHPAMGTDFGGMYADERLVKTKTLCDPSIAECAAACGIRLIPFSSLESRLERPRPKDS